jgi:hypothetical protein
MKALRGRRVAVVGGDGMVGRSEHGLLVVHGHPDAIDALLADRPLDTATGVDELRRTALGHLPEGIAGMVVMTEVAGQLRATTAGPEHVGVNGIAAPAERDGRALVHRVPPDGEVRLGLPVGRIGAAHDLMEGVVPGAGLALVGAGVQQDDDRVPPTHRTSTLTAGYDLTLRAAQHLKDAPDPPDLQAAPRHTAQLRTGATETVEVAPDDDQEREPSQPDGSGTDGAPGTVGFVVFDDGTTVAVDRPYVIGRQPPRTDDTPLVIDDHEHSVSRVHARLRPDSGRVLISDTGSSNGTHLWDPSSSSWRRLAVGEQTVLPPQTYVAVGRRVFVYVTDTPPETR